MVKNPNWQEADQLAVYKAWPRIWTQDFPETNPTRFSVEALNPGPPDYNSSAQTTRPRCLRLWVTYNNFQVYPKIASWQYLFESPEFLWSLIVTSKFILMRNLVPFVFPNDTT